MSTTPMRVLTLTQPWASLVAIGAKRLETRSWQTTYRGPLLIHAASGFPGWARATCHEQPFRDVLGRAGLSDVTLERGVLLARATLAAIWSTTDRRVLEYGAEHELAFGDYTPGRYAWFLTDVERLDAAIPARGALGLWTYQPSTTDPRV